MRIEGLASGEPSPADGRYVVEYDPDREGIDTVTGEPMLCHLVTTDDRNQAKRYRDVVQGQQAWARVSKRWPVRSDGRPNRPLTAFTVTFESV